jgi:hypothetical protein
MFHQVQNNESRFATTPQTLQKILTLVKESGLPVVLPSQATQLIVDTTAEPEPQITPDQELEF